MLVQYTRFESASGEQTMYATWLLSACDCRPAIGSSNPERYQAQELQRPSSRLTQSRHNAYQNSSQHAQCPGSTPLLLAGHRLQWHGLLFRQYWHQPRFAGHSRRRGRRPNRKCPPISSSEPAWPILRIVLHIERDIYDHIGPSSA